MNTADGSGDVLRKRQYYKGGMGLSWMGERSFQIWRKASVKAWRRERGSQKSNTNERILMCTLEGNDICNYLSISGSLLSSLVCKHDRHKTQILLIILVPTVFGRGPCVEEVPSRMKATPALWDHVDYSRIITSSDSLLYLKRMIRIKLWVPTTWTSKPIPTVSPIFSSLDLDHLQELWHHGNEVDYWLRVTWSWYLGDLVRLMITGMCLWRWGSRGQ